MSVYRLPPHHFTGGRQPLEGREGNPSDLLVPDPPFRHFGRAVVTALIIALSQPPDPSPFIGGRQPLEPRRANPAQLHVEPVTFVPFTRQQLVSYSTEYTIQRQRLLVPPETLAVPFVKKQIIWPVSEEQPQQRRRLFIPPEPTKEPYKRQQISWLDDAWQQQRRVFVPQQAEVVVQTPFARRQFFWPEPEQYPQQRRATAISDYAAATVDLPPVMNREWFKAVWLAWQDTIPDRLPKLSSWPEAIFTHIESVRDIYLPKAHFQEPPLMVWFYINTDAGQRIHAKPLDRIRMEETFTPSEGYIESRALGSALLLTAVSETEWAVFAKTGTWTLST